MDLGGFLLRQNFRDRAGSGKGNQMNPFILDHVPMLWDNLLPEFGLEVDYWPAGIQADAVTIPLIWIEGAEGEDSSPGRYSHVRIKNADVPSKPKRGDAVDKDGIIYDVVRVAAYAYDFATLILQERP